ncbi:hypothetical protein EXIGLDRAFT_456408 [Exidia glandulosa HHB12029]|uniref:Uncharacterized protein n=1 Tax=Exidia glandulosa HHB12029 TaxID=1314781 RepID=A0A165PMQ6_EXIGL|nr:hypothetical protein EXIGLDRAFT_456408 [Exidia glandulosa HHB12029]
MRTLLCHGHICIPLHCMFCFARSCNHTIDTLKRINTTPRSCKIVRPLGYLCISAHGMKPREYAGTSTEYLLAARSWSTPRATATASLSRHGCCVSGRAVLGPLIGRPWTSWPWSWTIAKPQRGVLVCVELDERGAAVGLHADLGDVANALEERAEARLGRVRDQVADVDVRDDLLERQRAAAGREVDSRERATRAGLPCAHTAARFFKHALAQKQTHSWDLLLHCY